MPKTALVLMRVKTITKAFDMLITPKESDSS